MHLHPHLLLQLLLLLHLHTCTCTPRYPEFGTTDELLAKYRHLTDAARKADFVQSIDGPEAASVTAGRALHSYRAMLCRRCFIYDCPLHSDQQVGAT